MTQKFSRSRKVQSFIRLLVTISNGWNKVTNNKRLMLRLIGVVLFNFSMTMLISKLEITSLHFSISWPALLLFSVLGSLSLFINLTPANLGIKEAIFIFSGTVIGFTTSQILLIALVDRGVFFIVLTVLWALSPRMQKLTD